MTEVVSRDLVYESRVLVYRYNRDNSVPSNSFLIDFKTHHCRSFVCCTPLFTCFVCSTISSEVDLTKPRTPG